MMVVVPMITLTMAMIALALFSCVSAGIVGYAVRLSDEDWPSASNARKAVLILITAIFQLAALSVAALIGGMA